MADPNDKEVRIAKAKAVRQQAVAAMRFDTYFWQPGVTPVTDFQAYRDWVDCEQVPQIDRETKKALKDDRGNILYKNAREIVRNEKGEPVINKKTGKKQFQNKLTDTGKKVEQTYIQFMNDVAKGLKANYKFPTVMPPRKAHDFFGMMKSEMNGRTNPASPKITYECSNFSYSAVAKALLDNNIRKNYDVLQVGIMNKAHNITVLVPKGQEISNDSPFPKGCLFIDPWARALGQPEEKTLGVSQAKFIYQEQLAAGYIVNYNSANDPTVEEAVANFREDNADLISNYSQVRQKEQSEAIATTSNSQQRPKKNQPTEAPPEEQNHRQQMIEVLGLTSALERLKAKGKKIDTARKGQVDKFVIKIDDIKNTFIKSTNTTEKALTNMQSSINTLIKETEKGKEYDTINEHRGVFGPILNFLKNFVKILTKTCEAVHEVQITDKEKEKALKVQEPTENVAQQSASPPRSPSRH